MPKYVARKRKPKSASFDDWDWLDDVGGPDNMTVYESDDEECTGILDASGTPLYRVSERQPMGFNLK